MSTPRPSTRHSREQPPDVSCHLMKSNAPLNLAIKQGRAVMAKILMGEAVAIMAQLEEMRERSGCKLQILDFEES